MRPMSLGLFSSKGRICFRPSFPSCDCACAAALMTERVLIWVDVVGDGEEEMSLEVDFMTPCGFRARRSRARPFCRIRSAWNSNRVSVFGRVGALSKILWDRKGLEGLEFDASLLIWAICLVERSGILENVSKGNF